MDHELTTFLCEKFHCALTRRACAERQAAVIEKTRFRKIPAYPGCQDCAQGRSETTGITAQGRSRRLFSTGPKPQKPQEGSMFHKRIDDDQLKKLIADGMFVADIAQRFDCSPSAVTKKIKKLGLTPNYRRQPKGTKPAFVPDAATAIPRARCLDIPKSAKQAPASAPRQVEVPARPDAAPQVFPIKLTVTIDVHIRVHTEAA
jgi:hypothetical protein